MTPLPTLSEARDRLDAHIGQTLASIAANVGIRPFGRGWHGRALELVAGLPDDNLPDPDGGDYEMKAVEIGPSGLPRHDVPVGRLPPGSQEPWERSRLRRKSERILFALWTDVPGQGPVLFGTAAGAIADLPESVARQMEADWERIRGLPDGCGQGRLLSVRRDGHGPEAARLLLLSSSLAAALMGRLPPDLLPLEPAMQTLPVPTIHQMTIGAWIGVRTNPSQRDHTNRRAAHLDRLEPQHLMVAAAQLPDGTLVKLDGHTRAHRWQSAPERFPHHQTLHVAVYPVASLDQAVALYRTFDSKAAVESSRDQLAGALRLNGLDPELARALALNSALETALGSRAKGSAGWLAEGVSTYRDEVQEIFRRAQRLKAHKFKSGMIGALILALRHHPRITLALLDALDSDSAPRLQIGRKRNVLCALAELLKEPGRQNHTDPAAERMLGILYVAHKDGIEAMRTRFPRISLDAYRTNGAFTLSDPGA